MKKYLIISLLAFQIGLMGCAQINSSEKAIEYAKDTTVIETPKLEPLGYVNDFEELHSQVQVQQLDSLIINFEKRKGVQIAIVTLDSNYTDLDNFDDYCLKLANTWGVGQKGLDNGVLIGISKSLRKMRIQNGNGIEKILNDEATSKIIQGYFIPKFKQGKYFEGTFDGLQVLISSLENNMDK